MDPLRIIIHGVQAETLQVSPVTIEIPLPPPQILWSKPGYWNQIGMGVSIVLNEILKPPILVGQEHVEAPRNKI